MKKSGSQKSKSPSQLIDARIKELGDWRGKMLSRLRTLVKEADPEVVEEWKWRGVPVWSHDGLICTGETYKNVVKMTFAKGAALKDPSGLFNSSLDGNKACHRLPRGREDRPGGVEDARSRRRGSEQVHRPQLIDEIEPGWATADQAPQGLESPHREKKAAAWLPWTSILGDGRRHAAVVLLHYTGLVKPTRAFLQAAERGSRRSSTINIYGSSCVSRRGGSPGRSELEYRVYRLL
jgi:hypothetical protein